jgi:hypothetical protein
MPPERQEAVEEMFHQDLHDGIEFISTLTLNVIGGGYDGQFGPEVQAIIYEDADGTKKISPFKGFKGHKDIT